MGTRGGTFPPHSDARFLSSALMGDVEAKWWQLGPRYFRFQDIYIAHVSISEPTWTPILR